MKLQAQTSALLTIFFIAHGALSPISASETGIANTIRTGAPELHPPNVIGVYTGTPLVWSVPVTGSQPLHFSAQKLPRGITFNGRTGVFSGILRHSGNYAVKIMVTNTQGSTEESIHIVAGSKIVLTPPMGWNSYDYYGDRVDEAEVLANARYLKKNMQPYGWNTVVVDYRWYDPNAIAEPDNGAPGEKLSMDGFGRLLPAPDRFPSASNGEGFKRLASKLHSMGLRFGIHIMRGIPREAVAENLPIQGSSFHAKDAANTSDTCPWCPDMYGVRGNTPAGKAYYNSLFRLYASWGVDYVKMDDTSQPYHRDEIDAVHSAIMACGRSIVYSLSPGETPIQDAVHVEQHANLWRVSGDFWDNWGSLNHEFDLAALWQPYVAPGHWPDADMLPLGHLSMGGRPVGPDRTTRFTHNEQLTLLSLWCLLPSPLMVGANLPDNDPWTLKLLTNPEVLAVDQDGGGTAAEEVSKDINSAIWKRTLLDGSMVVGMFNRGDAAQTISCSKSSLGLHGDWEVRDLWGRKNIGTLSKVISDEIPAHGCVLLKISKLN